MSRKELGRQCVVAAAAPTFGGGSNATAVVFPNASWSAASVDLSHATKLESMYLKWTNYITQEFWALGDKERSMKVPISPLCDRERDNNIAKSQMGFFKFICIPLFSVVADLVDPEMVPWVRLRKNMAMWANHLLMLRNQFL